MTTGLFSADAQNEAKPSQNQRIVYLIDGEKLIEICKRNQIGVKRVPLPELLVLDPEVSRGAGGDAEADLEPASVLRPDGTSSIRRLRDEMLGDSDRGLSVEQVAEISGYALNTVRAYVADDKRRKMLGDKIRADDQKRSRALQIVSDRRELRYGE